MKKNDHMPAVAQSCRISLGMVMIVVLSMFSFTSLYNGGQAEAAPAYVTSVTGCTGTCGATAATNISLTFPATPGNGNTLIAAISTRGTAASQVSSITQTGATWSRVVQSNNTNVTTEIWYAPNVNGASTSITITLAGSLVATAVVAEYSGLLTASAIDLTATATGSATTATSGTTGTTTQADELWIGAMGIARGAITFSTPGNSFVIEASQADTGGFAGNSVCMNRRIVSATGAASTSISVGGTARNFAGTIATFKAVAASAGSIQLSGSGYSINENGGTVTITATRTGGSSGAVGISYATSNVTAVQPGDYTSASGTLSWADGDTVDKTFTVTIINDGSTESNETFNVSLSVPTGGATLGSPSSATVTILDDDGAPAAVPAGNWQLFSIVIAGIAAYGLIWRRKQRQAAS